jgi:hypothetical protein
MVQKGIVTLFLGAAAALFLLPVLTPEALAQDGCLAFHAVLQEELPADIPLRPHDTWGGEVYATLGQEVFLGLVSGNDGPQTKPGTTIIATGGTYKFDFGGGNTFTAQANTSTAPLIPNGPFFGTFRNSERITEGEGRFRFASGNLVQAGPFLVYSFAPLHGRYNGEVTGNICGVQPPE